MLNLAKKERKNAFAAAFKLNVIHLAGAEGTRAAAGSALMKGGSVGGAGTTVSMQTDDRSFLRYKTQAAPT